MSLCLLQELLSFGSKCKRAGKSSNKSSHKLSTKKLAADYYIYFARKNIDLKIFHDLFFEGVLLRLIFVAVILFFCCSCGDVWAMFYNGGNNGVGDNGAYFDEYNFDNFTSKRNFEDKYSGKLVYGKRAFFDRLSVGGIEVGLLRSGSNYAVDLGGSNLSMFELTSLSVASEPQQTAAFYNSNNYRYINYDPQRHSSLSVNHATNNPAALNHAAVNPAAANPASVNSASCNLFSCDMFGVSSSSGGRGKFFRRRGCFSGYFSGRFPRMCSDFRNFNSCDSLGNLFVAFSGAALLANTAMDVNFNNWFNKNIVKSGVGEKYLDDFSAFSKGFGELHTILFFALSAAGYRYSNRFFPYFGQQSHEPKQSDFGYYATMVVRSYLVGVPVNLLGQLFIGAGRPSSETSHWFKGKYNGLSGHAFVGATPFIVAAQMTDNLWFKCIFYICSTFTGASRIYEDSHYLSQALLGWYIAYLSVRAISKTEGKKITRGLTIFPIIEKEKAGLGIIFKY
ncbi:MAG: phosphatase PAP2 family protein [Planctomycetaceae bacterium]|jgi:membrane-associated phospholipid phosphatase|nr:phosphatase PAP2 family protein [Planctomycetaceae bacterium]